MRKRLGTCFNLRLHVREISVNFYITSAPVAQLDRALDYGSKG